HAVAHHVRVYHGIWSDVDEADPRFVTTTGFFVSIENLTAQSEASEHRHSARVGAIKNLGATVQLDCRRSEKPQDTPRLQQLPARHDIDGEFASSGGYPVTDTRGVRGSVGANCR